MATKIDGVLIANNIESQLQQQICAAGGKPPQLAVILVGERKDSEAYVRMKQAAALRIGIAFDLHKYDKSVTQSQLEADIWRLNQDPYIHGIIVQLPLPAETIDESAVLQQVSPEKDVDGFHVFNTVTNPNRLHTCCTPRAVLSLLQHIGCPIKGATVVLIGTGRVGLPLAVLLMELGATVVCCNANTKNIQELSAQGDILVAAAGCPQLVKQDWVKPGAVVIDVGINSVPDATRKSGQKLVGDVDYDGVASVASAITPVPGGVGPLTVATLMQSVVEAWERWNALKLRLWCLPE